MERGPSHGTFTGWPGGDRHRWQPRDQTQIALGLARAGADVVPAARSRDKLQEVVAEIEALGRRSLLIPTDVSDGEAIKDLFQQTKDELGVPQILVNNAGISPHYKSTHKVSDAEWDQVINVNLRAVFLASREMANYLIAAEIPGSIINVGSVGSTGGLAVGCLLRRRAACCS